MNKTCIIIVGPTAIGKTDIAIKVAQHFSTQIISADSRQCFKELNIGVAKPSVEELHLVKHHFIGSHSIHEEVNAAVYEQYALNAIDSIFKENDFAVVAGGTGLYVKAFCEGMDEVPVILPGIREKIIAQYETEGIEWLQNELKEKDAEYYSKGEIQNPQRLMRALEVKLSTGKSIVEFQTQQKKKRDFSIVKIGLEMPRELLYERINKRVDIMMKQGLLKEVEGLLPYKNLNALQTVGYRELFDYFEGLITLEKAVELIKQNTRHYAKRQMTWFKKDDSIRWLNCQTQELKEFVNSPMSFL